MYISYQYFLKDCWKWRRKPSAHKATGVVHVTTREESRWLYLDWYWSKGNATEKAGQRGRQMRAEKVRSGRALLFHPPPSISSVLIWDREKKDSCIINALIMVIFCARLIHVKPSLCQIENWHFYFMNIAPSVTFIVHSQSCYSECQVNYQAFAFLPLYFLF